MKTCILISGEPRVYKHTHFTLKPFIEYLNADVFIHTWSDETTPRCNNLNDQSQTHKHSQQELEENLNEYYNPKALQIQNKIALKEYLNRENIAHIPQDYDKYMNSNYGSVGQWYSGQECNRIKQEYERQNGFKYDVQIKTRFDTLLNSYEESEYKKIVNIIKGTTTGVTDVFTPWFHIMNGEIFIEYSTLIGNNDAMDKIWFNIVQDMSWFRTFGHYNPHVGITEHIQRKQITLKHWDDLNRLLRIVRPSPNINLLKEYWYKKDVDRVLQIINEANTQWKL